MSFTWSYRIIRHTERYKKESILPKFWHKYKNKKIIYYALHEVHYRKNGKPYLVTEEPISTIGDTKADLLDTMFTMLKDAFYYPVLDMSYFDNLNKNKKGGRNGSLSLGYSLFSGRSKSLFVCKQTH